MSNPWAPKSIRDDADHEPLVVRAVQPLAGAAWVLLVGGVFGELALMLWLCLCRYRLGLSAGQATAALRASVIPSFTLARLYDRLYPR
ncbi:MAG: hypothetical protein K0R40_236 [Burkholderiales bacterium]|jgi:hypothetical protein|nr:hypothetical protein [Burkholderiales bacterium]